MVSCGLTVKSLPEIVKWPNWTFHNVCSCDFMPPRFEAVGTYLYDRLVLTVQR